MFGLINNAIGIAVLILTVMFSGWSWWISIPVGLVLMGAVSFALGFLKNKLAAPKSA